MNEADNEKRPDMEGFNPADLFPKGMLEFGTADLVEGGSFREIVGRMVVALLLFLRDKDGQYLFDGATIVLPPEAVAKHTEESARAVFTRAVEDLSGREISEEELLRLRNTVSIVHSPSLEVGDMLQRARGHGKQHIVVIADASQYQDPSLDLPISVGISTVRLGEDRWAPHVASLGRQLMPILKENEGYGFIHVPEIPAQKTANIELLNSVDDCYVACLHYENDLEETMTSRAPEWRSLVLQGRLPEVKAEIQALGLSEAERLHLLAQLLRRTGRESETLDVINQLAPLLGNLQVQVGIQVAKIALEAGDEDLAYKVFPEGIDGVGDQVWLEEGLDLATHFESNERIARFDQRLSTLFPTSESLRDNRDSRLIMNVRQAGLKFAHLFTDAGFTERHLALQAQLREEAPDYRAVLKAAGAWGQDWLDLAAACCAIHAQSVGNSLEAAYLASLITSSERYGRQSTHILLWALKSILLEELLSDKEHEQYRDLFTAALTFLAQHPGDTETQSTLGALLSVDSCGDMGIPILAVTMLELANAGISVAQAGTPAEKPTSSVFNGATEQSMKNAMVWLGELGAAEPGVTVIPRDLLVADPDDVIRAIDRLIYHSSDRNGEDADLEFMQRLVILACAICPHATQMRDEDIRLMRHLASQLAVAGQFQQARNLAESILRMGQGGGYRSRLAWQAFGDVYHRCHSHVMALVGLACALAVDVQITKEDLWHEVYAIHRVLRDLKLVELSRSFLPTMKELLNELGFDAETDPRYINSEQGLRLLEASSADREVLADIVSQVSKACQKEMKDRNRLLPLAFLLGQAVLKAEDAGVEISSETRSVLETGLAQVGASMRDVIRTVSTAKPSAKDVLGMFNRLERSMFASDVARDYAVLGLAARRLLDVEQHTAPDESTFAIELLADHTVSLPGATPAMALDWPAQYAAELNRAGLEVVFLALDSQGELVVTHISGGVVRAIEQPKYEKTFQHRFHAWLQKYPMDYGLIDRRDGNNAFFLTMEKLNVCLPKADRLLLVAEPFLQPITANLVVQYEDDGLSYFAGTKTAIGTVPSLSWFSSVRSAKRTGNAGYKAWISTTPNLGEQVVDVQDVPARADTLSVALELLGGCFERFGFTVNTSRRLPSDMKDAGLAVVTAHGGLNRDKRYLHSIRDDDDLVETPLALAHAFGGVELVILFVCSGGRIDKNPWDNSTTSLPKQLLTRGTRAVIASPWPLEVMVTYSWLEPFLQAWEGGATVLDATKQANDVVDKRLGGVPQCSLAMRVYGDVLLTKSAN